MPPSRTPFVGGNWKMNTDRAGAPALAAAVARAALDFSAVQVAVFPPFPYLLPVAEALRAAGPGTAQAPVLLGAQDLYHQPGGAFTGEVSAPMLKDCGVEAVLVGHSERRHVIGEPDDLVRLKTHAALGAGLHCVLCVGETIEQRRAGQADAVNQRQLISALSGLPAGIAPGIAQQLTIAYEPVWAIGTGVNATPDDAQSAHARIREVLAGLLGAPAAAAIRIQYGGSVKGANAAELMAMPDIDGALVGGASLNPAEFAAIIRAAPQRGASR